MSRRSIILGSSIFLLLSLWVTVSIVNAHTPGGMSLSYNSNTEDLSVTITHSVSDNNSHFIESVVVKVNGSTVLNQPYTSQPTKGTFTYTYANITANEGAIIQVTATCNIAGSITKTLTVSDGISTSNGGNAQDISGYYGIWIIIGFSLVIVLNIVRKKITGD